jgi:Zn-dependent M28 family amino/carboxypeptidase
MESTTSGLAALLDLARVFSKLFQSFQGYGRPLGEHELLFLALAGERHLNYLGTKLWLEAAESSMF